LKRSFSPADIRGIRGLNPTKNARASQRKSAAKKLKEQTAQGKFGEIPALPTQL
jgi:hypothetical protein